MKKDLEICLSEFVDLTKGKVVYETFDNFGLGILQIRDRLFNCGRIVKEDIENCVYIIAFDYGKSAFSNACAVLKLTENTLECLSYAKEGLFNQKIAEKNIIRIKSCLKNETLRTKRRFFPFFLIVLMLIAAFLGIQVFNHFNNTMAFEYQNNNAEHGSESADAVTDTINDTSLVEQYNNAVENYNTVAKAYNEQVQFIDISNISNMPSKYSLKETKSINSETEKSEIEEVINDIEKVVIDYKIVNNLTYPTLEWVTNQLRSIECITDVSEVTVDNDPDGLLGKEGSYYDCVYFSVNKIDQEQIPGNTLVDKGTDAGGAIELYDSIEKAINRCDYLGQFDNTLLYSGSYTIVGTMVVRTSYLLSNEEQMSLTKEIVDKFISAN